MIEPQPRRHGGVLKVGHYAVVAVAAIVGAVIAFALLSFLVGIVIEVVKIALVAAVVVAAFWFVSRRAKRAG